MRVWISPLVILASLFFISTGTSAQPAGTWTHLADFDHTIMCVYFIDSPGDPEIGFVGTAEFEKGLSEIWKTTDSGYTWTRTRFAPTAQYEEIRDICFKDAQVGWAVTSSPSDKGRIYATTDGGSTWSRISGTPDGTYLQIYYNQQSHRLFATRSGDGPLVSDDDGRTWSSILGNTIISVGFANRSMGYAVGCTYGNAPGARFSTTTDGGATWRVGNLNQEFFQPVIFQQSKTIYAMSDHTGTLYHSSDLGQTWDTIYHQPELPGHYITGCLRGNACGNLYAQAGVYGEKGFMASTDFGKIWWDLQPAGAQHPIANEIDTRFYERNDIVYVGQHRYEANEQAHLWRFVAPHKSVRMSEPLVDRDTIVLASPGCEFRATQLGMTYLNDCVAATLIDAHSDNPAAIVVEPSANLPEAIAGRDSVRILYVPESGDPITSHVTLRFLRGFDTIEKVIVIQGSVTRELTRLKLTSAAGTPMHASAGDTVCVNVCLRDSIPEGFSLDSLGFRLHYTSSMLSYAGVKAAQGWITSDSGETDSTFHLRIHNAPASYMAADSVLAQVCFRVVVGRDTAGWIGLDSITFNDGDFNGCAEIASSSLSAVEVDRTDICGERRISDFLRESVIFDVLTVDASGPQRVPIVGVRMHKAAHMSVYVTNEASITLLQYQFDLREGDATLTMPGTLRPGAYFIFLDAGGEERVIKVIVS